MKTKMKTKMRTKTRTTTTTTTTTTTKIIIIKYFTLFQLNYNSFLFNDITALPQPECRGTQPTADEVVRKRHGIVPSHAGRPIGTLPVLRSTPVLPFQKLRQALRATHAR